MADCFKPWRSTQQGSVLQLIEEPAREAAAAGRIGYGESRRALLAYHLATTNARLVAGHYRYSRIVFERYCDSWSFITVLRHPVARWYSHYYHNALSPPNDLHHIALPIEEYVETEGAAHLGNELVRSFADLSDPIGAVSGQAVRKAISHLQEFDLVGTLEDLPSFCSGFRESFGCSLDIPRLNVTPSEGREPRADVGPHVAERVRQFCEPDLEVYRSFFAHISEH